MYSLMADVQARTKALSCSKLLAMLLKANMVSQLVLHKCLQHLLACPSNVRAEAAADVLYLIEPFVNQHCGPSAAASMAVHYHKLQDMCSKDSKRLDAAVVSDVMVRCCGLLSCYRACLASLYVF